MTRFLTVTLAAALVIALSACADLPLEDWSAIPPEREARAHPVQYAHTVRFAPGDERLAIVERQRLEIFLARIGTGRGDRVVVAVPEAANAGTLRLDERRHQTVAAYLSLSRIETRPAEGELAFEVPRADTVAVIVSRYVVTLPGCPDWSERPGRTFNNTVSRNLGCASASNLGLMVANPADLEGGRRPGPMVGAFGVLAIQRYRKGETTPLAPEDIGAIESQQKSGQGGGSKP
jgi:pilus assembly protein CpaD